MNGRQRIYNVKNNALNEQERLDLARMLAKAGYAVRLGRVKQNPKSNTYTYFVEYWEESDE